MSIFGHCLAAPGTKADHYHALCLREFTDQWGVLHVCGCPGHDEDSDA